jgi:hypothetical protein
MAFNASQDESASSSIEIPADASMPEKAQLAGTQRKAGPSALWHLKPIRRDDELVVWRVLRFNFYSARR